ncbi:riboflavin biosynthesis protein RibD [Nocardia yunnanensis]|uniref:Riboflavin biosynthesis protein RibD n=1 Tax=Nocardia yunnanensis TaxID=2382165 RepID=A0A386ZER8_9NOCA|nr:dihydrofolate reductase family protein [Nocardia yunnanensis]AYF75897.1 riboflavin biosynthesis protein RibD [Nocardia yunnanensis]
MYKVIVAEFVTVDGLMQDPDGSGGTAGGGWAFRYGPTPVAGDKFRLGPVLDTAVQLLGRTTWELFGRIFSSRDDTFSTQMNVMEKLVVSSSLRDVSAWSNSTLVHGELAAAVSERLQRQDVLVLGSGSVVDQLIASSMVDEFRLMIFPTVLGTGRRLFNAQATPFDLDLAVNEDVGGGVLRQIYRRRPSRT